MKCNHCTHENVCKFKEYYITCENILKQYNNVNPNKNPLYVDCEYYDEIEKIEEPYEKIVEYKMVFTNGMRTCIFETLEDLGEECIKQLMKRNCSYYCYEKIIYSNGKVEINKLPL